MMKTLSDYELRDAQGEDIDRIAEVICPMDHKELYAASGLTPQMALWSGWNASVRCRVGCYQGAPKAMYGVVPYGNVGWIWLAGASLVPHAKFFLSVLEDELKLVAGNSSILTNYMDSRQIVHRKLLERRGFVFDESDIRVNRGVPFVRFIRRMRDV